MYYVVTLALVVTMALALARALLGPTVYDPVLSVNMFGTKTVLLLSVIVGLPLPHQVLWAAVGLLGTTTSLVFAALAQHFPETHIGRANTAANVMVFAMAFAYQSGMGAIVELWPPDATGAYPPIAYVSAFLTAVALIVAAFVWSIWPLKGRY